MYDESLATRIVEFLSESSNLSEFSDRAQQILVFAHTNPHRAQAAQISIEDLRRIISEIESIPKAERERIEIRIAFQQLLSETATRIKKAHSNDAFIDLITAIDAKLQQQKNK